MAIAAPVSVPVRVLMQVGGSEPHEVGEFILFNPGTGDHDTARALRALADEFETSAAPSE
ncbi:hypothetical protein [Nocardiopsis alba]|uniref:Uncharacterized protein n=1 Tax=Nocardiopsis alba TaxID=53437 RepID=A0A7K2IL97_9ACTN|nr:hypothetical protein [Nocardiopsis alba]MYR30752.1 hypothetical protein [Nocardiopsis alba]